MFYLTPLSTNYRDDPDFNESDRRAEFDMMTVRQDAIEAVVEGKMHPRDLLDLLESQEIDPVEYMDASTAAIEMVIREGIEVSGWLLPTT
jgi:hypothetical protein